MSVKEAGRMVLFSAKFWGALLAAFNAADYGGVLFPPSGWALIINLVLLVLFVLALIRELVRTNRAAKAAAKP